MTGMICMVGLSTVFAGNSKGMIEKAMASFNRDFVGATQINWQQEHSYTKATFTLNEQVMFAYYSNETGDLMAVARNILSDRLPISLMTGLKNQYRGYWISNLFELAADGTTCYYASLENANETILLKSNDYNEWTIEKKVRKN